MKKGEIWRVLIPAAPGHAQTGERPAIILQELAFNNSLPTTLIVPLTSKLAASRFGGTLVIQPNPQNVTAPRLRWCSKRAPWTSATASSKWGRLTRQLSTKSSTCWTN
jgi:mRNA-degrading endonuclease toxin of MazEF toxin-antitoxin module